MHHKPLSFAAIALATTLIPAAAFGGPATDIVKDNQTKLFEVIAQPKTRAHQAKLREMFDELFSYDVMAKESLGKKWPERSEAEKMKFSDLFTQLVRNHYKRNLKKMLDYEIVYMGEKKGKGKYKGTVLVQTLAKHKTNKREPDIEIDFRMQKIGGEMKIVDMYTERASLVLTYRSQYLRILRKHGFDEVIRKMEKKLNEME